MVRTRITRRRRRKAMASSQSTVARATFHLPLEMTIEILSRLPVKSLLRFKSVCNTWYDLIKTPDFISKHLQTQSTLHSTSLLVTNYNCETETHQISLISNDGLNNGPINLDFPFLDSRIFKYSAITCFSIVGICNGLICISLSIVGFPLVLCNPSTRQLRKIPGAERNWEDENVKRVSFGFGFDSSANDYKLIRIVLYTTRTRQNNIRADLYVMSTDTWTEIDVTKLSSFFGEMNEYGGYDTFVQMAVSSTALWNGEFGGSSTSALLNGVFYWPARVVPSNQVVVMSFDMGDQVFRRIRTPACLDRAWCGTNFQCMELNDKLALVVSCPARGAFDVWVLNEIESSWTHQVKVGSFTRIGREICNITVVGGLRNGELLVTSHSVSGKLKVFSYDIKTHEYMDLYFGQVLHGFCAYLYAGTLLPVMQANEVILNK